MYLRYAFFPLPKRATCAAHLIFLDMKTLIVFGEELAWWGPSVQLSPASCYFLPLGLNAFLSILLSIVLSVRSPFPEGTWMYAEGNWMYYWGYLNVLWLFLLVCILYCGCFNLFCNVWVCLCVCFVVCGVLWQLCGCFVVCGVWGVVTIVWVFWKYVNLYLRCG